MSNPNLPIVNAGIKYVNGCILQWASNTTMSLYTGEARDNRDENDIILGGSLSSPINSVAITMSTAFVGPGGLDAGTIAANTNYAVYVIGDSTKNNPATAVFSLSNILPSMLTGYDVFRRVGWMRTDGSSNILRWFQYGRAQDRTYYYDSPISVLAGGAATTFTSIALSGAMPSIFSPITASVSPTSEVLLAVTYTGAAATNSLQFGSSASASTSIITFGTGVAAAQKFMVWVPAFSTQLFYKVVAGDAVSISVAGFKDYLSTPQ
jgi:hypothetical protein